MEDWYHTPTKSAAERLTLPVSEQTRALTLLILLWRRYDAAGISMGRSHEAVLLETAIALLGAVDYDELAKIDKDSGTLVNETRDWLSAQRLKAYNENWIAGG